MDGVDLTVLAVAVLGYAVVSGRLRGSVVTPAMVFVGVGLAVGGSGVGWIDVEFSIGAIQALTTATLTLVLFTDALRIDVPALRQEIDLPRRLLGVGLPLTILAGTGLALLLFDELGLWPAAVLATVLAPTDAALGQAVVTDPSLPSRIRQGLNVESGLNDGLCVPLLAIFLTLAESEEGLQRGEALRVVVEEIGGGVLAGVVAGALGALLLRAAARRRWIEPSWHAIALVAVPAAAYGLAVVLHGSGFIAAFVAGLVFGRVVGREGLPTELAEELGELLGALTFLVFGAVALGPVLGDLTWAVAAYALLEPDGRAHGAGGGVDGRHPPPPGDRGLRRLVRPTGPGVDRLRPGPGGRVRAGGGPADRDGGRPDRRPQRPAARPVGGARGRALRPVVLVAPAAGRPDGGPAGHRGPAPRPSPPGLTPGTQVRASAGWCLGVRLRARARASAACSASRCTTSS